MDRKNRADNIELVDHYTSPWGIFVPFNRFLHLNPDTAKLPNLTSNAEANQMIWSTLGATLSITGVLGLATYLANAYTVHKWDKKKAAIHRNKVNAIHSYNTPNTANAVKAVNQVRNLGLSGKTPKLLENKVVEAAANNEALADEDPVLTKAAHGDNMEKAASGNLAALIPPLIAIPSAIALNGLFKDDMAETHGEELDKEIIKQRNKLDALYARLLALHGDNIEKTAGGDRPSAVKPGVDKPSLVENGTQLLFGIPIVAGMLAGYATYKYAVEQDEDFNKKKMLEKTVLPQNLTNAPAEVQLVLGKGGKIPHKYTEQSYVQAPNKAIGRV